MAQTNQNCIALGWWHIGQANSGASTTTAHTLHMPILDPVWARGILPWHGCFHKYRKQPTWLVFCLCYCPNAWDLWNVIYPPRVWLMAFTESWHPVHRMHHSTISLRCQLYDMIDRSISANYFGWLARTISLNVQHIVCHLGSVLNSNMIMYTKWT